MLCRRGQEAFVSNGTEKRCLREMSVTILETTCTVTTFNHSSHKNTNESVVCKLVLGVRYRFFLDE